MTTGTEGPDVLANDTSLRFENIEALGGDDRINVTNPHPPGSQFERSSVRVDGGAGTDTLNLTAPYFFTLSPGLASIGDGSNGTVIVYPSDISWSNVERLIIFGNVPSGGSGVWRTGDTHDFITAESSSFQLPLTVYSMGGDDYVRLINVGPGSGVYAGAGNDRIDLVQGGFFADGGEGNDDVAGSNGSDRMNGGPGADIMVGHSGDDAYFVDDPGDSIHEFFDEGADSVHTSLATYVLPAHFENLFSDLSMPSLAQDFTLNEADNRIITNEFGDIVRLQQGGDDDVLGMAGNDIFYFGTAFTGVDKVDGGGGRDSVVLQGDYVLELSATNLSAVESLSLQSGATVQWGDLAGNSYDYSITTNDSNVASGEQLIVNGQSLRIGERFIFDGSGERDGGFLVFGGADIDWLTGGDGDDMLVGAGSADRLTGGTGNNVFRYDSTADSTAGAKDLIINFLPGVDKIDLSRIDANTLLPGDQAFHWIGGAAFSGAGAASAGELRTALWIVQADTDGDGVADLVIDVPHQGAGPLSPADFIL